MRREQIRRDRTEQGIGTSSSRALIPFFFENTWEISLPTEASQTGGISLAEKFISLRLSFAHPQEMNDRKERAGGPC